MNKLEMLAAKLYCIYTAGNYLYPASLDAIIKDIGKEIASIPYRSDLQQDTADKARFIAVSREDLIYIHKAIMEALQTPENELLPVSVNKADTLLVNILHPSADGE